MSLTRLICIPEVAKRLDEIIPDYQRKFSGPCRTPSTSKSPSTIGIAYDYLLRFEVQRLRPDVKETPWIADAALSALRRGPLHGRAAERVNAAHANVRAYRQNSAPRETDLREVAEHALNLARIDPIFRAGYLGDAIFATASAEEVDELISLIKSTPIDNFAVASSVLLNPNFGEWSFAAGGADADLIVGNRLIDLKTTAAPRVDRKDVRQLVGYFLLARFARAAGQDIPEITSLELYFARYGSSLVLRAEELTAFERFGATERWFKELLCKGAQIRAEQLTALRRVNSDDSPRPQSGSSPKRARNPSDSAVARSSGKRRRTSTRAKRRG